MRLQEPMRPLADLLGKSEAEFRFNVSKLYADDPICALLEKMVQAHSPKIYRRMRAAYCKFNWVREEVPIYLYRANGLFLLRVTLYKLQTSLHRDPKDLICVLFCGGEFEGGKALFPDLNVKFK